MGYRWFQGRGIAPLFPFGFGLSYTTFDLSNLVVTGDAAAGPVTASVTVRNTGPVPGAEVVQVYLGVPVDGQPPKRLVGFAKAFVEPGESATVSISIDPAATNHPFGVWDYATAAFVNRPGRYTLFVGASSEDTPLSASLTIE